MNYQTTIKSPFTLAGQGLHTGKFTHVTVKPAPADTGIVLLRIDLSPVVEIPAKACYVHDTNHGTTLSVGNAMVSTIEHMMSAFNGLGVDNAFVEVDGPEVPILDGSAILWVNKILSVGLVELDAIRHYITLPQTIEWSDPDAGIMMVATPADDFSVDCQIEFKSELIGSQQAAISGMDSYMEDIARCRTFVFLHEVEALLAHNLIKGGDLDNALVFADKPLGEEEKSRLAALFNKDKDSIHVHNGVLNTVEPFFPNEPARHKLLDFLGDIYLLGAPVKAHFSIKCPGHRANTELAKKISNLISVQ